MIRENSSGQGVIPYRQYSLRTVLEIKQPIWCDESHLFQNRQCRRQMSLKSG